MKSSTVKNGFRCIWVASAICLSNGGYNESTSRTSRKSVLTPATEEHSLPSVKEETEEELEGEFYCRLRNLPNKWPEYVFRCSIKKENKLFVLRSLEETDTRLSIKPISKTAARLKGVVFLKERKIGKQYPHRWVVLQESTVRVSKVVGKPYLEGPFRAVLQFESQRKKGGKTDFRKGTTTPIGQEATVEFVISR